MSQPLANQMSDKMTVLALQFHCFFFSKLQGAKARRQRPFFVFTEPLWKTRHSKERTKYTSAQECDLEDTRREAFQYSGCGCSLSRPSIRVVCPPSLTRVRVHFCVFLDSCQSKHWPEYISQAINGSSWRQKGDSCADYFLLIDSRSSGEFRQETKHSFQ